MQVLNRSLRSISVSGLSWDHTQWIGVNQQWNHTMVHVSLLYLLSVLHPIYTYDTGWWLSFEWETAIYNKIATAIDIFFADAIFGHNRRLRLNGYCEYDPNRSKGTNTANHLIRDSILHVDHSHPLPIRRLWRMISCSKTIVFYFKRVT